MFVDSHCHLDRVDLTPYGGDFSALLGAMRAAGVGHSLCVSIDLEAYPSMLALVEPHGGISVSVGVHPNERDTIEPAPDALVELAATPGTSRSARPASTTSTARAISNGSVSAFGGTSQRRGWPASRSSSTAATRAPTPWRSCARRALATSAG